MKCQLIINDKNEKKMANYLKRHIFWVRTCAKIGTTIDVDGNAYFGSRQYLKSLLADDICMAEQIQRSDSKDTKLDFHKF